MQIGIMRTEDGMVHLRNTAGEIKRVPMVTLITLASATKLEANTGLKMSKGSTACQHIRNLLGLPRNTRKVTCAAHARELLEVAKTIPVETVVV